MPTERISAISSSGIAMRYRLIAPAFTARISFVFVKCPEIDQDRQQNGQRNDPVEDLRDQKTESN